MATLNVYPTGIPDTPYVVQIAFQEVQQLLSRSPPKEEEGEVPVVSKDSKTDETVANVGLSSAHVETVILLDVSGSMGQNVTRTVRDYIPNALEKAGYSNTDVFYLITFSSTSSVYKYTLNDFRASHLGCQGSTLMKPGIEEIRKLTISSNNRMIRIITISDGELQDQHETFDAASKLASYMKELNFTCASSAMRLFTSSVQPDTRGLSSMLQLDTLSSMNTRTLVDVNANSDRTFIIYSLSELLKDKLGRNRVILTANSPIFLRTPWSSPCSEISLNEGENTFWLTKALTKDDLISIKGTSGGSAGSGGSVGSPGAQAEKTIEVFIKAGEQLNYESYNNVLKERIDYFMNRLKILKVLNTPESQVEVKSIVEYFKKLEGSFERQDQSLQGLLKNNLQSRLAFFRGLCQKKSKSVSLRMAEVANDDRVGQMNSAQQADYLRSAGTSANSKSLAKRAIKSGLDFDSIAIAEVRAMAAHIQELAGIDDSTHYLSFYSQETTLQGIKAVCELVDDGHHRGHGLAIGQSSQSAIQEGSHEGVQDTIDSMSALDILQLLNIVGIPCVGPIGDFPDPKTYHLHEMFLGSFVSMSDVIMVKHGGSTLRDPYSNKEINNVIPFYDDDRIQQFLMKYAKTLLEYTASLGMRNMILDVPHTYKYTIVGGLWNMARRLNEERTEVNVDVFMKLVVSYKTAVDHIFDYVVPLFKEQTPEEKAGNKSFYISNNGTTNMISPMINVCFDVANNSDKDNRFRFMPDVLRALYSFEIYQVIRKFNKSDDDKVEQRKQMLDKLLGVDFSKYGTPLPPMFEEIGRGSKAPKHHEEWHVDDQMLNDLINRFYWLDHIVNLPEFLVNALKGSAEGQELPKLALALALEGKAAILALPKLSDERIMSVLNLTDHVAPSSQENQFLVNERISSRKSPRDLRTFKLFCIVQAFLFDSKADRVHPEKAQMLIEDCGNRERMEKMLRTYIEKQYRADFQARLAQQNKLEREQIAEELADRMATIDSEKGFIDLFKNGLVRNHVSAVISDSYQLGFTALRDRLFDPNFDVKHRKFKLTVLVMGIDSQGNTVWNKGNALRAMAINALKEGFIKNGLEEYWENTLYPAFKIKNKYMYRNSDKPNRHTHCNSKTSFWAYGFQTVGKYFSEISQAERDEYCKIHTHCCGIWDGKLVKPA